MKRYGMTLVFVASIGLVMARVGKSIPERHLADAVCEFDEDDTKKIMTLTHSCTTDKTIVAPDGWALDGNLMTITAVDSSPTVDFKGGVVSNSGQTANVHNLVIVGDFESR